LYLFTIIFFVWNSSAQDKNCLCFEVTDSNPISEDRPISISLNNTQIACWEKGMVLIKKSVKGNQTRAYQMDEHENKVWFKHNNEEGIKTTYCFVGLTDKNIRSPFGYKKEDGDLMLTHNDKSLIHYRYQTKMPPQGVNPLYQKSGYIHPVISSKGDTLSRIQPPDHYHHYGIWGPWTRTRIDDVGVDFWNLKEGQGTVLFKSFNGFESGKVFAGFSANQEHINLTAKEGPKVAINEELNVKVWINNKPNQYFIDYTSKFKSPLKNGILFEAYRYGGGLGFRFKEQWNKENCEVITSEGKNRVAADGSSARWAMVYGVSQDGKGTTGVLFMSHPNNQSHPEPMRVWPLDANSGRGDMFFQFCPIRHEEWKIEPQKTYQLNYRMLIFDGKITLEEAEQHWKAFAFQPEINYKHL